MSIEDLKRDLSRALEANNWSAAASVRSTLVAQHPDTSEAAEAAYKQGLHALYQEQVLARAAEYLRLAARAMDPDWSLPARVSLGLVMLAQGKGQQAVFELRKAAGIKPPNQMTAQAAGLVAVALAQHKPGAEVERAREQYKGVLQQLTKGQAPAVEAWACLHLGMEFKHDGQRAEAKQWLHRAAGLNALGPDEADLLQRTLGQL